MSKLEQIRHITEVNDFDAREIIVQKYIKRVQLLQNYLNIMKLQQNDDSQRLDKLQEAYLNSQQYNTQLLTQIAQMELMKKEFHDKEAAERQKQRELCRQIKQERHRSVQLAQECKGRYQLQLKYDQLLHYAKIYANCLRAVREQVKGICCLLRLDETIQMRTAEREPAQARAATTKTHKADKSSTVAAPTQKNQTVSEESHVPCINVQLGQIENELNALNNQLQVDQTNSQTMESTDKKTISQPPLRSMSADCAILGDDGSSVTMEQGVARTSAANLSGGQRDGGVTKLSAVESSIIVSSKEVQAVVSQIAKMIQTSVNMGLQDRSAGNSEDQATNAASTYPDMLRLSAGPDTKKQIRALDQRIQHIAISLSQLASDCRSLRCRMEKSQKAIRQKRQGGELRGRLKRMMVDTKHSQLSLNKQIDRYVDIEQKKFQEDIRKQLLKNCVNKTAFKNLHKRTYINRLIEQLAILKHRVKSACVKTRHDVAHAENLNRMINIKLQEAEKAGLVINFRRTLAK